MAIDDDGPAADPLATPLGARDELDAALLRLHRLTLAATIHAGNAQAIALTPAQIRVLTLLAASVDGLSVTAVGEALSLSAPSASRLCQRLVRDGLVIREAGPGHYIALSLSTAGARTLRAVNRARVAPLRRLIQAQPADARASLIEQLDALGRLAGGHPDAW